MAGLGSGFLLLAALAVSRTAGGAIGRTRTLARLPRPAAGPRWDGSRLRPPSWVVARIESADLGLDAGVAVVAWSGVVALAGHPRLGGRGPRPGGRRRPCSSPAARRWCWVRAGAGPSGGSRPRCPRRSKRWPGRSGAAPRSGARWPRRVRRRRADWATSWATWSPRPEPGCRWPPPSTGGRSAARCRPCASGSRPSPSRPRRAGPRPGPSTGWPRRSGGGWPSAPRCGHSPRRPGCPPS